MSFFEDKYEDIDAPSSFEEAGEIAFKIEYQSWIGDHSDFDELDFSSTDFGSLIQDSINILVRDAKKKNNSPSEEEIFLFLKHDLEDVIALIKRVRSCFHESNYGTFSRGESPNDRLIMWKHRDTIWHDVHAPERPMIQRTYLEECVKYYLEHSFRSQRLDRLLVDALIADEVIEFSSNQLKYDKDFDIEKPYLLRKIGPGLSFIFVYTIELIIVGIVLAGLYFLHSKGWLPDIAAGILAILIVVLFLGLFVFNLVKLPGRIFAFSKAKKDLRKLIDQMHASYLLLQDTGVMSSEVVLSSLKKASDLDAIWPASLYPLLEDIGRRGGRF